MLFSCQCGWQPYHAVTDHSHGAPGPRAASQKSVSWRIKSSAVFVPVVVVIALVSAAIWYFFGPAPQIVYTTVIATTVLIIACPLCAGAGDADVDYFRRRAGG